MDNSEGEMNGLQLQYRVLAVKGADPTTRKFVDLTVGSSEAAERVKAICAKQGYTAAIQAVLSDASKGAVVEVRV